MLHNKDNRERILHNVSESVSYFLLTIKWAIYHGLVYGV